jgi:hypothetical protein
MQAFCFFHFLVVGGGGHRFGAGRFWGGLYMDGAPWECGSLLYDCIYAWHDGAALMLDTLWGAAGGAGMRDVSCMGSEHGMGVPSRLQTRSPLYGIPSHRFALPGIVDDGNESGSMATIPVGR